MRSRRTATRPAMATPRRAWRAATSSRSPAMFGATSSAAAEGVAPRRSAARSATVVSVSWPTPVTTGSRVARIARASASLLNAMQVLERTAATHEQDHVGVANPVGAVQARGRVFPRRRLPAPSPATAPRRCTARGARSLCTRRATPHRCAMSPRRHAAAAAAAGACGAHRRAPSALRRCLSCSMPSASAPTPLGSSLST